MHHKPWQDSLLFDINALHALAFKLPPCKNVYAQCSSSVSLQGGALIEVNNSLNLRRGGAGNEVNDASYTLESPPAQEGGTAPSTVLRLSAIKPTGDRVLLAIARVSFPDGRTHTLSVWDCRADSLPLLAFLHPPRPPLPSSGSGFRQTEELTVNTAICFDDARPCAA